MYTAVGSDDELRQVLELQKINLPKNLTEEEINSQGFVTVIHSYDTLKKMNDIEQSIIAKSGDKVIGYLLAMTGTSKNDIPVLVPMFEIFNNVIYSGKKISAYRYIVVGQVCIAKEWRGRGILDDCYNAYKEHFLSKYEFAITEIDKRNKRSINAHLRIGFQIAHSYKDSSGVEWDVVLWDWRNN